MFDRRSIGVITLSDAGCLRKKAVVSSPPVGVRSVPHHKAGCITVHSGARHWHCVHLYGPRLRSGRSKSRRRLFLATWYVGAMTLLRLWPR